MILIPGELLALATFPGVILHEYAHKLFCEIVGLEVYEVVYFRIGNPAGYVAHEPPRTFWQSFVISVAPFIINTLAAIISFIFAKLFAFIRILFIFFIWLGISFGMHAFPSTGDAKNIWTYLKLEYKRKPYILIFAPIIAFIYIANILSVVWFDLAYAIALYYFITGILF